MRGPSSREHGRQQRSRAGHGQADDDRAGDADRAQDHELEQDQPDQAQQHGQAAEEDGPAGGATVAATASLTTAWSVLPVAGSRPPPRALSSSRKRLVNSSA